MVNVDINKISPEVSQKFQIENNTFSQEVKSNPKDRIQVEIGDSKQPDFKPQFKFMRWDNEVNFSLRAPEHPLATVETEAEKIKYKTSDYEIHLYDKPNALSDGGFEFEWVLNKKPTTNTLTATIETKGLDFFYQSSLTQEEIDKGATRPENVVGSYAVYHKTKGGMNDAAGKEYKVGKAFHIYRPHLIDAEGKETWGELNIDVDNKLYTITIDQNYLDNAVYPVRVGTPGTATDYFRTYDAGGEEWSTTPANMVDGSESTYASTATNNDVEHLTSHGAPPHGNISKVEIRAFGYGDGTDGCYLRPVFPGGDGDNHSFTPPNGSGAADWSAWFDITADTNAPADWDANFTALDVDVQYWKSGPGADVFISKVEVRETYDNETFGYTVVGSSKFQDSFDYLQSLKTSTTEESTLSSISFYLSSGTYDDGPQKLGVYSDAGGGSFNFEAETSEQSSLPVDQWNQISLSTNPTIAENTICLLSHWGEEISVQYDSDSGNHYFSNTSYPGSWPDPYSPGSTSIKFSIYVTYTPSGGEPAVEDYSFMDTNTKMWGG